MKSWLTTLSILIVATTVGNCSNMLNTNIITNQSDNGNKLNNNLINDVKYQFSDTSNDNNYFQTTPNFSILKNWNNYAKSWNEFVKLYPTFNFDQQSSTSVNFSTNWDDRDYNSWKGTNGLTNTNDINTSNDNIVIIPSQNWKWSYQKILANINIYIWHDDQNIFGKTTFSIFGEGWYKLIDFKLNTISFNNK